MSRNKRQRLGGAVQQGPSGAVVPEPPVQVQELPAHRLRTDAAAEAPAESSQAENLYRRDGADAASPEAPEELGDVALASAHELLAWAHAWEARAARLVAAAHTARAEVERRRAAAAAAAAEQQRLWSGALPTRYTGHRAQPCPACRRVRLDTASQAVVATSTRGRYVYLRCRACGHRWKLAR